MSAFALLIALIVNMPTRHGQHESRLWHFYERLLPRAGPRPMTPVLRV